MVANRYQLQATADRVRTVQIEAPRGVIYDDKGRVLVQNRTSLVVTIDPSAFGRLTKDQQSDLLLRVATELTSSGTPTKVADIRTTLADKQYSLLQPIPIAIDVPDDVNLYFSERASEYPSVAVERESVRDYPNQFAGRQRARLRGPHLRCRAQAPAGRLPGDEEDRQAVPTRQRDRQERSRGGLRGRAAGHARHREDRGGRGQQPGARAERDAADRRRQHRAEHRHRRPGVGRGGVGRAS